MTNRRVAELVSDSSPNRQDDKNQDLHIEALTDRVEILESELKQKQEEVDVQKEELETQLEELKVNNEDLENAHHALQASESNLKKAEKIANIGYWDLDLKTNEACWSDNNFRILGYSPNGVKPGIGAWYPRIHPDDFNAVVKNFQDAIAEHRPYVFEYRIVRTDGAVRWVQEESDAPVLDQAGKPIRIFGTIQDITSRKINEDAIRDAKEQAELYLDLITHDINNYNQISLGYIELALEPLAETENRDVLKKALDSLNNSSRLIDNIQVLQKVKAGNVSLKPVDLGQALDVALEESLGLSGKKVDVKKHFIEGQVFADELLKEAFLNIITNAVKHASSELDLSITIKKAYESDRKYFKVAFEDSGPGIPDEVKGQLFSRFVRGRTKAKGSGLGLFIVKSLVDGYHGRVWVEDRVQGDYTKGSRFVIMLPAAGVGKDGI
jgi:PAS domain S-box-containing protein